MNLIASLLPPSNVVLDLEASSKKRLFEELGELFENNNGIARAQVFDCLFAREKLGSTGLGQGVAIPHGRAKGLRDTLGAFVRLKAPLDFDSPDNLPVTSVFALLVPEAADERHLKILSELAQMFSDPDFRNRLTRLTDPSAVHQVFSHWQAHDSDNLDADPDPSAL